MRRQASRDHGVLIAYAINVIFHSEWAVIALVCFGLDKWLNFPSVLWQIALAIWFIWPAIITFLLSSLVKNSEPSVKSGENKNPYSKKTEDILPKVDK